MVMIMKIKILSGNRVLQHPWSRLGLVRQCPTWLLKALSNPLSNNKTDLLTGDVVHQDLVWEDIKKNGMQEPLLIIVGWENKVIRLESGNHRIQTAIQDGYTHLPVALQVIKGDLLNPVNGLHKVDADSLIYWDKTIKCAYPVQYDPSNIINIDNAKSILMNSGELHGFIGE